MAKSGRKKKQKKNIAVRVSFPQDIYEILVAQAKHESMGLSTVVVRAVKNRLIVEKYLPNDAPERLK
jgi:hypothetical protein